MAASVAKFLEMSEEFADDLDELEGRMLYIKSCIDQLPSIERTVMRYRYMMSLKWEEILEVMNDTNNNYSMRQIFNIHQKALRHIAEL